MLPLAIAVDRLSARDLLACISVCTEWKLALSLRNMDPVWSTAAALEGLVFVSDKEPQHRLQEPTMHYVHALRRWLALARRFDNDAINLSLDCPLEMMMLEQRPIREKRPPVCEICAQGKANERPAKGEGPPMTHTEEVLWSQNVYNGRFDCIAVRQGVSRMQGSPSAVMELNFKPPSAEDATAE